MNSIFCSLCPNWTAATLQFLYSYSNRLNLPATLLLILFGVGAESNTCKTHFSTCSFYSLISMTTTTTIDCPHAMDILREFSMNDGNRTTKSIPQKRNPQFNTRSKWYAVGHTAPFFGTKTHFCGSTHDWRDTQKSDETKNFKRKKYKIKWNRK